MPKARNVRAKRAKKSDGEIRLWLPEIPQISWPLAITIFLALFALYLVVLHPWLMNWGATSDEQRMSLPGDELNPNPASQFTRAITIEAPPTAVWAWLVQIGQDRAGFYSNTWLENLALASMPESHEIRPEWQKRAVGDLVPMARIENYGIQKGSQQERFTQLELKIVDPVQTIGPIPGIFNLVPVGARSTRLILRERSGVAGPIGPGQLPGAVFERVVWDPMHFVMERGMLQGIKERAEYQVTPVSLDVAARLGWSVAGAVVFGLFFVKRGRWYWLAAPIAIALPVALLTGDLDASLAGFIAVGIPIAGALVIGRRWWPRFLLISAAVMLTLVLSPEPYLTFGVAFLLLLIFVAMLQLRPVQMVLGRR